MLGSEAPQLQSSVFNVQQANSLTVQHKTTTPSPPTTILAQVLAQGVVQQWVAARLRALLLQPAEEVAGGADSILAAGLLLDWSDGRLAVSKFQRYLSLVYFSAPCFKEFLFGLHFLTYSKTF